MNHEPTPFRFKEAASLIRVAFRNWLDDRAPRMGAALAYYIALSLAPTALILLAITRWAFGPRGVGGHFVYQIQNLVGYPGATAIQAMIEGTHQPSRGIAASVIGLITVFWASSAVVSELKDAMNTIWRVPGDQTLSTARTIFNEARDRILSFGLVMIAGVLMILSLLVTVWVFAAGKYLNAGASLPQSLFQIANQAVSFIVIASVFAFIFKVLPRVALRWNDVAIGAVGTALLFIAGKFLLGLYFAEAGFAGTYGAAGSLVIVLVWVYYSAQVLFLGAEFTRAYTYRFGSMFTPENHYGLWQTREHGFPPVSRRSTAPRVHEVSVK